MRYADLHLHWLVVRPGGWGRTKDFTEAQGAMLWCPACRKRQKPQHPVVCLGPDFPDDTMPGPGRWSLHGTGADDLTLTGANAEGSSVSVAGGCGAHFFVTDGEVSMA